MIKIYIPKTHGNDTRFGDSQIIYDSNKKCVVIDGGCGTLATDTLSYLKANGLKHVTLIITHWHYDHYYGARKILDSSEITVDEIICYDPVEIVASKISKSEYNDAKAFIARAKALGKPITYLLSKTIVNKTVGDIKMKLWRVKYYKVSNDEYASVNNTSICTYFPELYYVTSGDMGDDTINMINAFGGTIRVFKIPHHGNACPISVTNAFKNKGAKLCWYNDLGNIDKDGFLAYGARRCKQGGLVTLNTSKEIVMVADNSKLTVTKNGTSYSYGITYSGSGKWMKNENGWWYKYANGKYPASQWLKLDAWYYFDERGYAVTGLQTIKWSGKERLFYFGTDCRMKTGWQKVNGEWYYFDTKNGAAKSGWIYVNSNWYYLDPVNYVMVTGWINYNGKKYYCEPVAGKNQGHMYKNCEVVIDGKSYSFDENGAGV